MTASAEAEGQKVMAYKDEYEVARLYSEPAFREALAHQFVGIKRPSIYLAPPLLSRIDPRTGRPTKRKFGPWIFGVMALLAKGKWLRESWADPFGRTIERKAERALRDEYLANIALLTEGLEFENLDSVMAIAALPDQVRGYGPVKEEAITRYQAELSPLLSQAQIGGKTSKAA